MMTDPNEIIAEINRLIGDAGPSQAAVATAAHAVGTLVRIGVSLERIAATVELLVPGNPKCALCGKPEARAPMQSSDPDQATIERAVDAFWEVNKNACMGDSDVDVRAGIRAALVAVNGLQP
jgi:hypothetical protein